VVFVWDVDRYAHRIEILDGGHSCDCLTSVEGDGDSPWPPSPPLQQMSVEEPSPGHRVAFLLGMAGKSHWSASVECDAASSSLVFDIACRVQQAPQRLGSQYRAVLPVLTHTHDQATVSVRAALARLTVEPLTGQPAVALVASAAGLVLAVESARIPSVATIRWKYRIALPSLADSR